MSRESQTEGTSDSDRRWHHFRPEPRRRSDLMGFNSTWWMVMVWVLVVVLIVYPFPLWL